MKKIIVVGASGTIGRAVADLLAQHHQVIRVGRRQGDLTVDLCAKASIEALLEKIGPFDAIVSAAGESRFGKVDEAGDDDFMVGIAGKLMGQVNLIRLAPRFIAVNGSVTITTGVLAQEPWPGTAPTAMVNAGLEGIVRAAALDLGKGLRVNAVSPVFVTETAQKLGMDTVGTMSATETAKAYRASVEGEMTGLVLDVRDFGKRATGG